MTALAETAVQAEGAGFRPWTGLGLWSVVSGFSLKRSHHPASRSASRLFGVLSGYAWSACLLFGLLVLETVAFAAGAAGVGGPGGNWDQSPRSTVSFVLSEDVSVELVWIPAGSFTMGSLWGEPGRFQDELRHRVTLTEGFWLGTYEVTQAQYEAVMGDNPSDIKGRNIPVTNVSWEEARLFCDRANELLAGKLPSGYRLCLPTEAQWEYACRASTSTAIYSGNLKIIGKNHAPALDSIAWYGGNSSQGYSEPLGWNTATWPEKQYPGGFAGPHPVGKKKPNGWNLHDMLGNVWEWCEDWYDDQYGCLGREVTDPTGPESGTCRVLRGGGWLDIARGCRAARRDGKVPGFRFCHVGFRLALSAAEPSAQEAQLPGE